MARRNLIYSVSTEEPTVVGIGCMVTATYVIALESIYVNMGDPLHDVNGSGSTDEATRPKSPMHVAGVSVAIVLGARESRAQGEGPQPVGVSERHNRMQTWRHLRGRR